MRRILLILVFTRLVFVLNGQIIADHSVVDDFYRIPSNWIDSVKTMHFYFPGMSHSVAYRTGLELLEDDYPEYQVSVGVAQPETDNYLRSQDHISGIVTEERWYTGYAYEPSQRPDGYDTIPRLLSAYNDRGYPFDVIGFAWCWTMMSSYISNTPDPVYGVRWRGTSHGGPPDFTHGWGLDANDFALTGNPVSMDTYLTATEHFQEYCDANGIDTKVVYTTGPVDASGYDGEPMYQAYLKHEYIRDFVRADPDRILFDYADILCYDNGSDELHTTTFDGYTYPSITPANLGDASIAHIGVTGVKRIAKAVWWLMARVAGWDGIVSDVYIESMSVRSENGLSEITSGGGTLQLYVDILPFSASGNAVSWSIENGSGEATINQDGLVTAVSDGTVTATITANDGSGLSGQFIISISGNGTTSVADMAMNDDIKVISRGSMVEVQFENLSYTGSNIMLCNLNGQIIKKQVVSGSSCYFHLNDGSGSGVYLLVMTGNGHNSVKRVFVDGSDD